MDSINGKHSLMADAHFVHQIQPQYCLMNFIHYKRDELALLLEYRNVRKKFNR